MTRGVGLDVRLPVGGLFAVLGLILAGYGLATAGDATLYARSLSVNINLWWGVVMLGFGLLLLLSAGLARHRAAARSAERSPQGEATEAREQGLGLER